MRAAPELTKDVVDSVQWMTGAPDVDGIPQPYAGAIVLLETFASIGMTARRDGQPTPNSLLCTKFANDLRLAATPRATADVERDAARWRYWREKYGAECRLTPGPIYMADAPEKLDAAVDLCMAHDAITKGAKP